LSKIDPHISIGEVRRAKDSEYCIRKDITIDHLNLSVNTPFKVLEGKNVNLESAVKVAKKVSNSVFESARVVGMKHSGWDELHYLVEEAHDDRIKGLNRFFGLRKDLSDAEPLRVLSLVLMRNPFELQKFKTKKGPQTVPAFSKLNYTQLLDFLHVGSQAMVLSPDMNVPGQSINSYLRFVDRNMSDLNSMNNKPIFAPIQPQLTPTELDRILSHYKLEGYVNIWVNFNGSQLGGTYFARMRTLLKRIDKRFGLGNVTLYCTHVKKEATSNLKNDVVLSSDIMSQFFSADFMGVNYSRPRNIPKKTKEENKNKKIADGEYLNEEEYDEDYKIHHTRVFDPRSYYYYKITKYPRQLPYSQETLTGSAFNGLLNSSLLRMEVESMKSHLSQNDDFIKPYLKKKKGLRDNPSVIRKLAYEGNAPEQTGLWSKLAGL